MDTSAAARTIATALSLERPLVVLDLETTGTNPETDRIIEIGVTRVDPDGTTVDWATFVNPTIPIPPSSTEIHGITDADVAVAPVFGSIAASLAARLEACDLAGYNLRRFDLKVLATEFKRVSVAWSLEKSRIIDAYRIFARKEPRDLAAARRFYLGETEGETHRAGADVSVTLRVLAAQLERAGYEDLPRGLKDLDEWCVNRDPSWLDDEGKFVWRDGCARIAFGQHSGTPMKDVHPDYFGWMLSKDFGPSTKAIAKAAAAGIFPMREETPAA